MKRSLACVALCLALFALAACGDEPASDAPATPVTRTIALRYDGGTLRVEVAATPAERARGLGGRASLAVDAGMLFVLGGDTIPSFWMKDTLIPLDMIWISADKRIAGVQADVQPEPGVVDGRLRRYSPEAAIRYVLEVNGGAAARLGLRAGDQLTFDAPAQ